MKQTDIYTEALTCLRSILLADHPESGSLHLTFHFFDPLCLVSKVKVNPSLPLKVFRRTGFLSSSDLIQPLNVTHFLILLF